jgi:hypothetical protein
VLAWIKVGGILTAVLIVGAFGYWLGGMAPKTALAAAQAAQAMNTANAVLAERASAQAQAAADHTAEAQRVKDQQALDALTPVATPLLVFRAAPALSCAVPGAETSARALAADPATRGSEPVGGGVDVRPAVEALKKRLEGVMADYRELKAEWPK